MEEWQWIKGMNWKIFCWTFKNVMKLYGYLRKPNIVTGTILVLAVIGI